MPVLVGCFEKKLLGHNCCLHKDCCSKGSGSVAALKLHENRARHEYVCKNWEGRIRYFLKRMNKFDGACKDVRGLLTSTCYCEQELGKL